MCSTVTWTSRHYERKQERKSKPEVSVTLWRQQQPLAWSRYHLDDYEGPSSWLWTLSPPHDSDRNGDNIEATEANKGPKTRHLTRLGPLVCFFFAFNWYDSNTTNYYFFRFYQLAVDCRRRCQPVSQPAYWRHVKNLWHDVDNAGQQRATGRV